MKRRHRIMRTGRHWMIVRELFDEYNRRLADLDECGPLLVHDIPPSFYRYCKTQEPDSWALFRSKKSATKAYAALKILNV